MMHNADPTMQWSVRHLGDLGVIEFTVTGVLTLDSLRQLVAAGVAASATYGTHRILVDYRNVESALTTLDIYGTPELERSAGATVDRVAMVMPPATAYRNDFLFYENRAVNTGAQRRVFLGRDAALAWLAEGA